MITTTHYVWDGANMVYEYTASATDGMSYLYGIGLLARKNNSYASIYLFNAHGDVTRIGYTEYVYDAFGNLINSNPNDTNPFRYCGEYYDSETETYYLRARYYNPATARFLSQDQHWNVGNMIYGDNPQDPLGLGIYIPDIMAMMQSGNLYVYVLNNPLRWIDPSGKAVTDWDRNNLHQTQVDRLQWITDHWNIGTKEQQDAWRAEAEGYRAMWRNMYEYTDDSGITRSTETGREIKYYINDNVMGSSTETRIVMKIGYSINDKNEVVLAKYRQIVRFVNASMGAYYSITEQSFTTDGTNVYYDIKYKMTSTFTVPSILPIIGGMEWQWATDGGHTYGTIGRVNFK